MKQANKFLGLVVLGLMLTGLCSGCGGMGRYQLNVFTDKQDPRIQRQSIQVDLVGITQADYPFWQSYPMNDYWAPNSALRRDVQNRGARLMMSFGKDCEPSYSILVDGTIWDLWEQNNVSYLCVLADLPGVFQERVGVADPRRLILPLKKSSWPMSFRWCPSTHPIIVQIELSRVNCLTPPKPD